MTILGAINPKMVRPQPRGCEEANAAGLGHSKHDEILCIAKVLRKLGSSLTRKLLHYWCSCWLGVFHERFCNSTCHGRYAYGLDVVTKYSTGFTEPMPSTTAHLDGRYQYNHPDGHISQVIWTNRHANSMSLKHDILYQLHSLLGRIPYLLRAGSL